MSTKMAIIRQYDKPIDASKAALISVTTVPTYFPLKIALISKNGGDNE